MLDLRRFRTHVEILSHRNPGLVVKLIPDRKKSPAAVSAEAAGFSLKWNKKLMHSAKDPEGEARHILDRVTFEAERAYVVFGLGLGHLAAGARALLAEKSSLILIEPEVRILREVLAAVDLRALLYDDRVHLVSGRDWHEAFRTVIRHCHEDGCRPTSSILALPSYRAYFERALDDARGILAQSLNERDIDTKTRLKLWDVWNQNLTQNIPHLLTAAPVRNFSATFKAVPAVLVGAGPSLDDLLKDMNLIREGAMIIASDTALAPLLSAGCEPDLVLAMDAQEANAIDFAGLPEHSTTLLFDAFCFPSIPNIYPSRRKIASLTGHIFSEVDHIAVIKNGLLPMLEYLAGMEFGFLQNGGSVITAGFDLARLAGCSALCLAGVDLSYPGLQSHSKHTRKFVQRFDVQNRFATPEWDFYDEFSPKARMRLDSASGGKVWSDRVLVMYKQWMEDSAAKAGLPCFTLGNPRGLLLKGYPPVGPGEFVRNFGVDRKDIEERLTRCRNLRPAFKIGDIRERIGGIRKDMECLDRNPVPGAIGPFDLEFFVQMASFEISERLRAVMAVEPESRYQPRREQAARAARKFVAPFLDALEAALEKV